MAWTWLQSAYNTAAAGSTTSTVTYGSNVSSGTKLLCVVGMAGGDTANDITSVKDGAGNTMTLVADSIDPGFNGQVALYAMDTPAGDVGTKPVLTAINTNSGNSGMVMLCQEVSGLAVGNTLAAMVDGTAATANGSSTGPATTGAYSSTAANEYLVAICATMFASITVSDSAGYTADSNEAPAANNPRLAVNYKNSSNGSESASFALSATSAWDTILVAFQLAATAPVAVASPPLGMNPPGLSNPMAWHPPYPLAQPPSAVTASAGLASGTGTAQGPSVLVQPNAGQALGTGTAQQPAAQVQPNAGLASGTGTAQAPVALVQPNAGLAAGTGTSQPPVPLVEPNAGLAAAVGTASQRPAPAGLASGTGTAQAPVALVQPNAGLAFGTGTAQPPSELVQPVAGLASGTGTAQPPVPQVTPNAGLASGTGTALQPQAGSVGLSSGTGTAPSPTALVMPTAGLASGAATAQPPAALVQPGAALASGSGTSQSPVAQVQPTAGLASGTGTALQPTVSTNSVTHSGAFLIVLPPGWRNQNEGGALSLALPALATSLHGTVAHTGGFNIMLPPLVTSVSAVIKEAGPFNPVLPVPVISITGTVTHTGAFNVTLPVLKLPLSGRAGRNTGTFAAALPAPATGLQGVVAHVGVLVISLAAPPPHLSRFEMFGVEERGELAVVLPELVTGLTAKVPDSEGTHTVFKAGRWIAARLPRKDSK